MAQYPGEERGRIVRYDYFLQQASISLQPLSFPVTWFCLRSPNDTCSRTDAYDSAESNNCYSIRCNVMRVRNVLVLFKIHMQNLICAKLVNCRLQY